MSIIASKIKHKIKSMGHGNVKYHSFPGKNCITYKYYTCSPSDDDLREINWYVVTEHINASAKRVHTDKHPEGFLEIVVRN